MNHIGMLNCQSRFVALKLPDEVPLNIRQLRLAFSKLLWTAFAEDRKEPGQLLHPFPLCVLSNRYELYVFRIGVRPPGRRALPSL